MLSTIDFFGGGKIFLLPKTHITVNKMTPAPQKIRKLAHSEAKKTKYYQKLVKRNFRRHSNYLDFKTIMSDIAVYLMTAETGVPMKAKEGHDPGYMGMLHSAYMTWNNPLFPVYAIKPELVNAFMHTDIPTHVCRMKKMFDIALFLLPSGLIKNPDRLSCDWLLVTQFELGDYDRYTQGYRNYLAKITDVNPEKIDVTEGLHAGMNKFRWATNLSGIFTYANIMALPDDGDTILTGEFINRGFLNDDFNLQEESAFTRRIDSLILQTMLYMQLPKQQINPSTHESVSPRSCHGFDPHSPQEPIWIGLEERFSPLVKKQPQGGGTHASPVTHWRRGHWRMVGGNSNADESRLTWIRPTIVNG